MTNPQASAKLRFVGACLFLASVCASKTARAVTDDNVFDYKYYYFDFEARRHIVQEFANYFSQSYAGFFLKNNPQIPERNLGSTAIMPEAINAEELIVDPDPAIADLTFGSPAYEAALPAHATANLKFYDRVLAALARFHDSHILFQPTIPVPYLSLGVDFIRIGGKYYAANRREELGIAKGDRFVEIDGQDPSAAAKPLESFIGANSDAARQVRATDALTFRNFALPAKPKAHLKIMKKNYAGQIVPYEVDAPWFVATKNVSEDANLYLGALGFDRSLDSGDEVVIENKRTWNPNYPGYRESYTFDKWKSFSTLESGGRNSETVLNTGIWAEGANEYGVVQIFSFSFNRIESGAFHTTFLEAVAKALAGFKEKNLPVILDVRNNAGGSTDLAFETTKLFLKKEQKISPTGLALRLSSPTAALLSNLDVLSRDNKTLRFFGMFVARIIEKIKLLQKDPNLKPKVRLETPVVNGEYLSGGDLDFGNPLVILIGPRCRSACEIFARHLTLATETQAARAISLGQPTEGTGMGYFQNDDELREFSPAWKETSLHFGVKVPNFMFTQSPEGEDSALLDRAPDMCVENRPLQPKVAYETTLLDLEQNDLGWFQAAAKLLPNH